MVTLRNLPSVEIRYIGDKIISNTWVFPESRIQWFKKTDVIWKSFLLTKSLEDAKYSRHKYVFLVI